MKTLFIFLISTFVVTAYAVPPKKITEMTSLTSVATSDLLPIVDISDTTDSPDGTTKKVTVTNLKAGMSLNNVDNTSDATKNAATATLTNKTLTSPVINSPTGIVKGDVGLGNVDNTSDATKNAATATLTNKTLTSPVINSPTGIAKGDVGLGNVDNTSDANKPISSLVQDALDAIITALGLKQDKPIISKLTSDSSHENSDGAIALTDLDVAVAANVNYLIECYISYNSATAQAIIQIANNYPASYVSADYGPTGPNEVLAMGMTRTPANGTPVVQFLNVTTNWPGSTMFYINFKNGSNAGTVAFRWISVSTGDATTTIYAGSFCRSTIIP